MTDKKEPKTAVVGGRVIGVLEPTEGQWESIIRIRRTLARSTDDDPTEFYVKQIERIGTLLENLIEEKDRDLVDDLFLTGKISSRELMGAIFSALSPPAQVNDTVAVVKKAANGARTKRS
jgi:hypothetical protein